MLPAVLVIAVIVWVADQSVSDALQIWQSHRRRRRQGA
jgi:hypothetical protein